MNTTRLGLCLLLPLVLLLQGCQIRVFPGVGGTVVVAYLSESRVGACDPACTEQLEAGDNLDAQYTATPNPGFEFRNWSDSLGDSVAVCPNATNPVCLIQVNSLLPALEGLELDVQANFINFNAYIFNLVAFSVSQGVGGAFVQLDNTNWIERYSNGTTFNHVLLERQRDRIILRDDSRNRTTVLRFDTGQVQIIIGTADPTDFGTLGGQSGSTTGHLVKSLSYNNPFGIYHGDLTLQGDGSWLDVDPKGKRPDTTLVEIDRFDYSLVLGDEAESYEIIIDFGSGQIERRDVGGVPKLWGYLRGSTVPVTGWNVNEIRYADLETGELMGILRQQGETVWGDHDPVNDALRTTYLESNRLGTQLTLADTNSNNNYLVDLTAGHITLPPIFGQAAEPLWDIVEVAAP